MHEAAYAAPLLRIVLEEAARQAGEQPLRVTQVTLRVGLLTGLEASTLQGCFALMAEGTAAEGGELLAEAEPMHGRCAECENDVSITTRSFSCPECGADRVNWKGGNELFIASIKVRPASEQAA